MKKFEFLFSVLIAMISTLVGGGVMAVSAVAPLDTEGATIYGEGAGTAPPDGGFTLKDGEAASPELFEEDVDKRITRISQMRTPIDQISRKAGITTKSGSLEVKYYSVGNKPIKGLVAAAVSLSNSADRFALEVNDAKVLDVNDTVRFVGVNGYKEDGSVDTGVDFVALVIDIDSSGKRVCQPVNAKANGVGNPAIPEGATFILMGKAGAELDVQTSVFSNVPTPDTQYCQKFMMQLEESTWADMNKKEVDWGFNDLEKAGVERMKIGMEGSFMFGVKKKFTNVKNNQLTYTTGGIYWMVGKQIEIGEAVNGKIVITDDNLVDLSEQLFTGEGAGNRIKVALAGKKALSALSKVKSEGKYINRKTVEVWDLKFKSFESEFGELLVMYCEMMDLQGKEDEVLVLDPEYMTKKVFKGWSREEYDMKKLALRDTKAVVLSETSCLYLTNKDAHAILKLAAPPVSVEGVDLNKSTLSVEAGATDATLVASISPADATNKAVTWSSGTAAVATVSAAGVVTGVTAGSAVITVTTVDGSETDTCTVTVTAAG